MRENSYQSREHLNLRKTCFVPRVYIIMIILPVESYKTFKREKKSATSTRNHAYSRPTSSSSERSFDRSETLEFLGCVWWDNIRVGCWHISRECRPVPRRTSGLVSTAFPWSESPRVVTGGSAFRFFLVTGCERISARGQSPSGEDEGGKVALAYARTTSELA